MTLRKRVVVEKPSRRRVRVSTLDREGPDPPALTVLTTEQIGITQALTPEGFLLCTAVAIARTGEMLYGPGETPIGVGPDGLAHVFRDEQTLFHQDCMSSFMGKPVVDDHPIEGDVKPDNWTKLSKGFGFNVRRGDGDDADVLFADLLIMDAETIRAVQAGKREISCGYEADYEDLGEGYGRQTNIYGNHIALVERGRCGPRCAIGDHQHEGTEDMGTPTKDNPPAKRRVLIQSVRDSLEALEQQEQHAGPVVVHIHNSRTADADGDEDDEKKDDKKTEDEELETKVKKIVEDCMSPLKSTMDSITAALGKLTKDADKEDDDKDKEKEKEKTTDEDEENDEDKASKTADSAALETSFKQLVADAEILVPGFKLPTFDATAKRKATVDTMCNARRKALDTVYATAEGKQMVDTIHGSAVNLITLDCKAVAQVFAASVGAKKLLNNSLATRDSNRVADPLNANSGAPKPLTPAEFNEQMKKHYGR